MKKQTNTPLIFAIIVAALLVSGSLLYLGQQMSGGSTTGNLQAEIEKGIGDYVAQQQADAAKAQAEANKPQFVEGDFTDDDPFLGDENAPVTIVEWSDYECPFCKRFFQNTLPQIKENYIDTGKVKLVFRDFPLDFHNPLATQQAYAANCAREQSNDETYFAYHDLIFETTRGNGRGMEVSQLYDFAEILNLDKAKLQECVESEKYKDEVAKDFSDGKSVGIGGTPGFLVNGQLISGAQPYSVFEAAIEAGL